MKYQQFIGRDPKICGGEPVIKGTRVTVRTGLASLAEGATVEEIREDVPTLKVRVRSPKQQNDPNKGKPIIDTGSRVLAKHDGFTVEELDFIIHRGINCQMGQETGEGEE